jgi:hypothetical protein
MLEKEGDREKKLFREVRPRMAIKIRKAFFTVGPLSPAIVKIELEIYSGR